MAGGPVSIFASLRDELMPFPGRLSSALHLTGAILVTVYLCMALGAPEAALSCYLVFFAWRDNAGDGIFTAVKLLVAGSLAVVTANPVLQAVVNDPMLRLAALSAFTFVGMFLAQATRLGEMASTAGFIFAFMLTIYDIVPIPEVVSVALEWIWVVLTIPMLVLVAWSAFALPRPAARALELIEARRSALKDPHGRNAQALLNEGMARMDSYLTFARVMGEARGAKHDDLARRADDSFYALALAEAGVSPRAGAGATPPPKEGLFLPDAFSNPRYTRFAFKVLVASLVTYGFYTIFGYFEIHTAMITCYFVSLGTTGATRHKIILRQIGCLIGALLAWGVMVFIMPHASDIGWLLAMIALPTLAAAWISLGTERISYAGWQLGLCFYLVILSGSSPPTSFSEGTGRIIGVLVGTVVVWIVFGALWPDDVCAHAKTGVDESHERTAAAKVPNSGREIAYLRAPIAEIGELERDAAYERGAFPHEDFMRAKQNYLGFIERSFHAAP